MDFSSNVKYLIDNGYFDNYSVQEVFTNEQIKLFENNDLIVNDLYSMSENINIGDIEFVNSIESAVLC